MHTETITLTRGFIDESGKAHRKVVIRAPLIDDEVKADAKVALAGASKILEVSAESASDSLWDLHFAAECIVSLGEIRTVGISHLRTLSRADARRITAGVAGMEARLEARSREQAAAEEAGTAEGKDETGSPGAPSSSSGETPSAAP